MNVWNKIDNVITAANEYQEFVKKEIAKYKEEGKKPDFKGAANELITALVKFDKIVGNY